MLKKMIYGILSISFILFFISSNGFAQEDKVIQVAIQTARMYLRIPREMEVQFIEKKQSPIPGFYSVKLSVLAPDKEIPLVVYVDEMGEKVILGSIIIKGQNVTQKEAGLPKPRKIDLAQLEIEKSPFRGNGEAKVTIVEFSNFQCSYCQLSWTKIAKILEKYPQDIKYVFKHFPIQSLDKSYTLSEMASAAQELGHEAFWVTHDFFFSNEGQMIIKEEMGTIKEKIEQILKEKGYDIKIFQTALEKGLGKGKVEEDLALGRKIQVAATPTTIVNGEFTAGGPIEQIVERSLGK